MSQIDAEANILLTEYGEPRLIEAKGKPEPVPVWEALKARSTVPAGGPA